MTFEQWLRDTLQSWRFSDNHQRWGQFLFNALHDYDPSLANEIRGTENDPFYVDHVYEFCRYVSNNWKG